MEPLLFFFQYKDHDLIQFTNGSEPRTSEEFRDGWRFLRGVPISSEEIAKMSARSPSAVVAQIDQQGYCQLDKYNIAASWREMHTLEGKRESLFHLPKQPSLRCLKHRRGCGNLSRASSYHAALSEPSVGSLYSAWSASPQLAP